MSKLTDLIDEYGSIEREVGLYGDSVNTESARQALIDYLKTDW